VVCVRALSPTRPAKRRGVAESVLHVRQRRSDARSSGWGPCRDGLRSLLSARLPQRRDDEATGSENDEEGANCKDAAADVDHHAPFSATAKHDGRAFHSRLPMTSPSAAAESGCCTAYMTFACVASNVSDELVQ
jgi:hypothetical protein